MEPFIVVSADGHCGARPATYRDYIDLDFRGEIDDLERQDAERWARVVEMLAIPDDTLDVIDDRGAIRAGRGVNGTFDPERRLAELDEEGAACELLFPNQQRSLMPFFTVTGRPAPPELRAAGTWAYHRWLADFMSGSGGRLLGVFDPGPCLDLDETIEGLRWAAGHGFVSASVPGGVVDEPALPPLQDLSWEPFWAACADLGLVLSVHVGHGHRQGELSKLIDQSAQKGMTRDQVVAQTHTEENPLHTPGDLSPRRPLWQLMLGGVFDRHPGLHFAITEAHADWLPATMAYLDERFERGDTPLRMRPREYWQRQGFVCASSILRAEVELRHGIGVDTMMFGIDYPHPESTWPNTRDWIRDAFTAVPEPEVRSILGENAIRCYRLDRDALAEIAARIGPRPDEVLGVGRPVDPRRLADFDTRAAYRRPAEHVDIDALDRGFTEDIELTTVDTRGA
jgi:predicted TIM-barrel fold metal-dependent hydrolase